MRSMTGYGKAELNKNGRSYIIDIRTVNNKYNDISIKIPKTISFAEEKIRKQLLKNIKRGKIDATITFTDYTQDNKNIIVNRQIASKYIEQLKEVANQNNLPLNINLVEIIKLPDVLTTIENSDTQVIIVEVMETLQIAIKNLIDMRTKEGEIIKKDLKDKIMKVEDTINAISSETTGLIKEYVVKLEKRIKEILNKQQLDEQRIEQEVVIYADKISIEEELTRLKSHIQQFKEIIEDNENTVGKKIDFIIQEMNRETNTIGSKSGSLEITRLVIDLKIQLEDIREQIQNIE